MADQSRREAPQSPKNEKIKRVVAGFTELTQNFFNRWRQTNETVKAEPVSTITTDLPIHIDSDHPHKEIKDPKEIAELTQLAIAVAPLHKQLMSVRISGMFKKAGMPLGLLIGNGEKALDDLLANNMDTKGKLADLERVDEIRKAFQESEKEWETTSIEISKYSSRKDVTEYVIEQKTINGKPEQRKTFYNVQDLTERNMSTGYPPPMLTFGLQDRKYVWDDFDPPLIGKKSTDPLAPFESIGGYAKIAKLANNLFATEDSPPEDPVKEYLKKTGYTNIYGMELSAVKD